MTIQAPMRNLGPTPLVHPDARVRDCTFGRYTEVGARTLIAETEMGDYSYVVNDSDIIYTTIGKFCSIASHVRINPGDHPMHRISQSHFTYRSSAYFEGVEDDREFFDWRRSRAVNIGHDVWIGHGAIVLAGRNVGTGAVIAAGAIVTRDVDPYTIVAGVPAKPVRERFTPKVADKIMALAWWDWEHERLQAALDDFRALAPEEFIEKHR